MASVSTLVAASVLPLAVAGSGHAAQLAAMLALLVGACFALAASRASAGSATTSRPVLIGYIHGVAVVLVIAQLGKLLGIPIEGRDPVAELVEFFREIGEVSGVTVAVSVVSLACLALLRFWLPRFPAALLVVLVSIVVSWKLDLAGHGVAVVGEVPAGLPSFAVPNASLTEIARLLPCGARDLPRGVRRRDPDSTLVRREAQPTHPRLPGTGCDGCSRYRRRAHTRVPDRRKQLADCGERLDGRAHARSQEGSLPASSS
jgi:hypothetical protein